jgi:hypothetical protein
LSHQPAGVNPHGKTADWQERHQGTPADRDAHRQRRQDLAAAVAARLTTGREMDDLADRIRELMVRLRACQTPAQRAEVEAELRPLVQQRRALTTATT